MLLMLAVLAFLVWLALRFKSPVVNTVGNVTSGGGAADPLGGPLGELADILIADLATSQQSGTPVRWTGIVDLENWVRAGRPAQWPPP